MLKQITIGDKQSLNYLPHYFLELSWKVRKMTKESSDRNVPHL